MDTSLVALLSASGAVDGATWHRHLGHIGDSGLQRLVSRKLVDGLNVRGPVTSPTLCLDCIYGKHAQCPFTQWIEPEDEPLERVYIDLWGPAQVDSIGGHHYYMSINDGGLSWCQPFFILDKAADTTLSAFKHFKRQAETVTGRQLKAVRMDQGSEFRNEKWVEFCATEGIVHEFTVPYTHQQVGVAERGHQTILEHAWCMLKDAGLPGEFWAEAVGTACYLKNLTSSHCHPGKTPFEIWTGRRPDVVHLWLFGCAAYMRVPDKTQQKLDLKSLACVMLGYFPGCMYCLWDPVSCKVLQSWDVIFDEGSCHWTRQVVGEQGNISALTSPSYTPTPTPSSIQTSILASDPIPIPPPLTTDVPTMRRSTQIRNPSC